MDITVKIATIDRTSLVQWQTFIIEDNINNQPNLLSFEIKSYDGQTYTPSAGDAVEVLDGATRIFAGILTKVNRTERGDRILHRVVAKDQTYLLEKTYITERYVDQTIADIIDDINTNFLTGLGITTNNVIASTTIGTVSFIGITVADALQKLANAINNSWYIDYDKDIHFFAKNQESSPFDLEDGDNNHIDDSLIIIDDISQLKNRVTIIGGDRVADNNRTKSYIYDGTLDERTFDTDYKFSELPTVEVNSSAKTVGLENVDSDADFDFLWDFNQKTVRATSTITLNDADQIDITQKPLIPIVIQVEDSPSITSLGGDPLGVFEFEKTNKEIKSIDEARQFGEAQLEAYSNQIREGGFRTYVSGLISGQTIRINLTARAIDDTFIIQRVSLKMFSQTQGEWKVELATYKTLGIISFLQSLLLNDTIDLDEDAVLQKFFVDQQQIEVTEAVTRETPEEDFQSIAVTIDEEKDPFGAIPPIFVIGEYTPTGNDDQFREFKIVGSPLSNLNAEFDVLTTTILYWPFNGAAASAAKLDNAQGDSDFDLIETNTPASARGFQNSQADGAYDFEKDSLEYLSVVNPTGGALYGAEGTIECWIQAETISGVRYIYDDRADPPNHIYLNVTSAGFVTGARYGSTTSTATQTSGPAISIGTGQWHYVVMTWKEGEPNRIYVDGTLVATAGANLAGASTGTGTSIMVAARFSVSAFWDGKIDELNISNFQKSLSEIQAHYAKRLT